MVPVAQVNEWRTREFEGKPSELPRLGREWGLITWDTETSALSFDDGGISTVSVGWWDEARQECWYAAWPFAQGKYGKPEDDGVRTLFDPEDDGEGDPNLSVAEWVALLDWLARAGLGLQAHNLKFDLGHTRSGVMGRFGGPKWPGVDLSGRLLRDTALVARDVWPDAPTIQLKLLAEGLWGEDSRAEQLALKPYLGPKDNPRYDLVPWEVMKPYAAKDAILTVRLGRYLEQLVEEGGASRAELRREHDVTLALLRMEEAGLPYPAKASREAAERLGGLERAKTLKLPFKVKEAKRYYFERDDAQRPVPVQGPDGKWGTGLGLEPLGLTPTGRVQFTAETLETLDRAGKPWAKELASIKKLQTAQTLWYDGYASKVAPDGRLRAMFRQVMSGKGGDGGTSSGRFSVERVNLQAIPHDYRLPFLEEAGVRSPRGLVAQAVEELGAGGGTAGWVAKELDLAQAELRVAAQYASCETMLEMIREGRDAHGETATALFGVTKKDADWDKMRQVAKRGNFSLIFGVGATTFQGSVRREAGIELTNREAFRIVNEWNGLYPEYSQQIEEESQRVSRLKYVKLVNGRKRWFREHEDWHKAFNQRVQASLAEYGKDWLVRTDRWFRSSDLGGYVRDRARLDGVGLAGLVMVIHDSQVLLLPADVADEVAEVIRADGVALWEQLWPGLPGAVDVKRWK